MRSLTFLLLLLLPCILLLSCSHKESETLRLVSELPRGTLTGDATLKFKFSRGVVPAESANVWMNTAYIQFSPDIPGKFIWQDTSTLIFSPDARLKGDTKYQARMNKILLLQYAKAAAYDGGEDFTFSTAPFSLKGAEFFYDRIDAKRQVGIKANIEFTYAVDPAEVSKYLKVWIDGAEFQGAKVMSTQSGSVIPVEIGAVPQTEKEKKITIGFDQQLLSSETQTHIKMDAPFAFTLPGIGELKIYGHEFGYDGAAGWITIKTSQEVDSASVRANVVLDPARPYTIEGDRNSLTLRGSFEPGKAYHLVIKKGIESILAAKTSFDYEADLVFGNIKPSFRFSSSLGTYMLMGGQKKIEIKTTNLSKVFVRVSQVFRNNVVFFLESGRRYDDWWDYSDDESDGYREPKFRYSAGNFGRVIWSDSIPVNNATNQEVTTLFEMGPHLRNDYKGFYLVEIANPSEPWRSTSKLLSLSNIGLIVKQSRDEVSVFATDLETTKPLSGAAIDLISTSNQTIASMKTDGDGVAQFKGFEALRKGFQMKLVTAELANDFNFINLEEYRIETSRFDVSGKFDKTAGYDAFLYGDRTLYRPGEKIYVTGIVRNLGSPAPATMPVKIRITNPRGTVVKELQQTLNEEGSFELTYQTAASSLTGTYHFALLTGSDSYLTGYDVSVEDFVPDRLKVNVTARQGSAMPGEKISYEIQALNFFGPPASGRNYEFEGTFSHAPFVSKTFREFRFSDEAAKNYSGSPFVMNGKTGNDGKAAVDFPLPGELTSSGLIYARGRVAVFDESNRPVYQNARTIVYPKSYFIGIRNAGDYYCRPNVPQQMQIVAVDTKDAPLNGFKAKIDVIRFEWHSVLRQHQGSGTLRYVSEKREIVERSDVVTLKSDPLTYSYSASRSGEYVVRVSKEGDAGYNQFAFYSYSWGTVDATSFEINPEAQVQIVMDDSAYAPGRTAKILFKTPFDGRMLVTVERNQVYSYRYLDVVNNAASMELPVEERFLPNVYVSAVLFRNIKAVNIPLLAGHGFAPLFVEKKSNRISVAISAPERIRPKTRQTIRVKTGNEQNVFVTVAAVDEGILQLKNYATPDPYKYYYARKALQTETFDFFKYLLPEPERSSTGGGDAEMQQRVNPLGVLRFKPVSLWSGILRTDKNGEAVATFDVPEFSGELRLMALAYKGDRFGMAQRGMKVADPVIITPALPRFLAPRDSIVMPITAFNTTPTPVKLTFVIETSGGITALQRTASLDLDANQERFVTVTLKTTDQIGKAAVKVITNAFGERFESETELPVRPVAPYSTEAASSFLEAGSSVTQKIDDVLLPYGRHAYITLSPFPVTNFAKELKYLVGYPHGCLEQTVSKAFPQIYLRDIAALLDPTILNTGSPTYFVNEAISKVVSMQLADGSFSYWPGGADVHPWATVYAVHFLLEAKKAGYSVPESALKSSLASLTQFARSKRTEDYYVYGPGQKAAVRRVADKSALYALYVLASAGLPEKTVMNFYRSDRALLTTDTRSLLAAAFALSGDRRTSVELMPAEFATDEKWVSNGDNFDSPIRSAAIILNLLLETDLNNTKIAMYMDYLSKAYGAHQWYSTQDDAFTLLAFGKAARLASATKAEGTITVGGKSYPYNGGNEKIDIAPFGKDVTIALRGEGRIYYSLVTAGIRSDGKIPIEDRNLKVRREFFRRDGSPADLTSLKQNDLLIVKLTLECAVSTLHYVAVTDLLPAGFEIENPRITESANYSFIKQASVPEYMDIRDDRINLYTSFEGTKVRVFYYMVRAVTAGVYQYAPVVAEAMYNGDYRSASGGMKIRINK